MQVYVNTVRTTTKYPKSKKPLTDYSHDVLKKPSSAKLGGAGRYVKKGKLKGAEVYTLTLTERETCPQSCGHWDFEDSCGGFYGTKWQDNGMADHLPEDTLPLLDEV